MVPPEKSNEFFGFYNIFGRFAAVSELLFMGIITQMTGNSSYRIFALIVLFVSGWFILMFVPEPEKGAAG